MFQDSQLLKGLEKVSEIMTNIDKLLNFLDEHDALHNFFAELVFLGRDSSWLSKKWSGHLNIVCAFNWCDCVDGFDYWKNLHDKAAGEL